MLRGFFCSVCRACPYASIMLLNLIYVGVLLFDDCSISSSFDSLFVALVILVHFLIHAESDVLFAGLSILPLCYVVLLGLHCRTNLACCVRF